jgi:hypothetical protein
VADARPRARLAAVAAVALATGPLVVTAGITPAAAEVVGAGSYQGPRYAGHGARGSLEVSSPTSDKNQSKTWWYGGSWWGLLFAPHDGATHVARLGRDHTWSVTDAVVGSEPVSAGDAVVDGPRVHVLWRSKAGLVVTTLRYAAAKDTYRVTAGPVEVGARGSNGAALAQDSLGRLWVSFVRASTLFVAHSDPTGAQWSPPYVPAVKGTRVQRNELSDIVAMDDGIDVVWSDQRRGAVHVATHRDDADDGTWRATLAVQGPRMADDHLSAHVAQGRDGPVLLVATKTSRNDYRDPERDDPLILLLERGPDGAWSQHVVSAVADGWTRPVVTSDASGRVYVFGRRAGSIRYKEASLDDLTFEPGPGRHLLTVSGASLTDPSVSQQVVDAATGLLLLASDERGLGYWHAELAVDGAGEAASALGSADGVAPSPPSGVRGVAGADGVRLSWQPASDATTWQPAGVPPALTYRVLRDGRTVGHTTATAFLVSAGGAEDAYTVVAVDPAGNASPQSTAEVREVAADGSGADLSWLVLLGVLVAAGSVAAGIYIHLRRHVGRAAQQAHALLIEAPRSALVPAPRGRHARR